MAGKKEKKDGAKGSSLPKSIAGMKLPKEVRRKLSELAKHPVVADLLAAGLVALAAKLKNEPEAKRPAAKADDKAKDAAPEAVQAIANVAKPVAKAKPVVKRIRKPAIAAAAPAEPVVKAPRKSPAAPAAPARPSARRKPAGSTPAKPRTPRPPKPTA